LNRGGFFLNKTIFMNCRFCIFDRNLFSAMQTYSMSYIFKYFLGFVLLVSSGVLSQIQGPTVHIVGAMKNVMWKGQLYGTINLDTIQPKTHLYGMGPVENLSGELLIYDGIGYKATVTDSIHMQVTTTFEAKAPFFGYAHVENWKEIQVPNTITTLPLLEQYLNQNSQENKRPFLFKIIGEFEKATVHVVHLPKGTLVHSPEEAHQGQMNYMISHSNGVILGFFSTTHQAIFTHHDTYMHLHLLTNDHSIMGHLDQLEIDPHKIKVYIGI
jgi:acetolactate decarboxylase